MGAIGHIRESRLLSQPFPPPSIYAGHCRPLEDETEDNFANVSLR